MKMSVIVATYNQHEWLRKALWGYDIQDFKDFELVIADDGSDERTKEVIETFRRETTLKIVHVWHEDQGFRKTAILNKAIVAASGDYLVFSDGDCIPRRDFLMVHMKQAEHGRFLSGGYCKLPMALSEAIEREDIESQRCFDLHWLRERGMRGRKQFWKIWANGRRGELLDAITPTKATFNGCNSSAWKEDILAVNGFDERMQYGGLDREIGERLENYGIHGKQIRHRAVCIHLDHSRGYRNSELVNFNRALRKTVRENGIKRTDHGISA